MHQRDKDTNEIVSIKQKTFIFPKTWRNRAYSYAARKSQNGKEITIVNEELNKAAKVKLDLNARNGLSIKDANTIEIKATEKKEQTIGKERYISDKERLEFVAQKELKGLMKFLKINPPKWLPFRET